MTKENRGSAVAADQPTSLAAFRARTETAGGGGEPPYGDPSAPDALALAQVFAAAAKTDSHGADFHRLVAGVLARADRVPEPDGHEWSRFLRLLARHRANPTAALNYGVLANLVAIAAFGDAADFAALTRMGRRLGVERVAAVQHRAARFIERDPTFPLTTVALRRMAVGEYLDPAVALLLEGIDPDAYLPIIRTEAEFVGVVDEGSVLEWRHHLAVIAASPWSPYSRRLVGLAAKVERPGAAAVVQRLTEVCRRQHKERERGQVAEEVRRLVAASGVTQREFAEWIGTSPSRLSTYVSGAVTPSASLMLRMTRTSRSLQERDVPPASSTGSEQSWGAARTTVDDGGPDGAGPGPGERISGSFARARPHLSAV